MDNTINIEPYRKRNREELESRKRLYIIALSVELLEILAPVDGNSIKFVTGALIDRAETLAKIHADPDAIEHKKKEFAGLFAEYAGRAEALRKKYHIDERKWNHERKSRNNY